MKLQKNKLKVSCAKIAILVFVFMLQGFNVLSPLQAQGQENPIVESILDSVIFQNNLLPPFSASYTKTMTWERAEGSGTSIEEGISHWDGIKYDYIDNSYNLIDNKKVPTHSGRAIWDGKQGIVKQVSFDPSQKQYLDFVGVREKADDFIFQKRSFSTYLSSCGKTEEGFVDLLRKSSDLIVKEQKEKIDGHGCYVLEGTTEKGHARVWIDPETGFNIRKIIISNIKNGEITNITDISEIVIDDIQMQIVEDIWLPMSVSKNMITKDSEGNIINEVKTTYKRTQFEFNPDFKKLGAFKMDVIPNGTRVKFDTDNPKRALHYFWQDGKIVPLDIPPVPLLGKTLPDLSDLGVDMLQENISNKVVLLCFFDIEQRPSRNFMIELNKRVLELSKKSIEIIVIHTVKVEQSKLNNWVKDNEITLPVKIFQKDWEKARTEWGIEALPWMILTDKEHIVIAEGFSVNEIDEKIGGGQ
ncbi:MAG: hypothetical protein JXA96_06000 [Sedimentisphaerales bacterium]|nr:hypothetical protein [Sedimentisphaerales bacterium]